MTAPLMEQSFQPRRLYPLSYVIDHYRISPRSRYRRHDSSHSSDGLFPVTGRPIAGQGDA